MIRLQTNTIWTNIKDKKKAYKCSDYKNMCLQRNICAKNMHKEKLIKMNGSTT